MNSTEMEIGTAMRNLYFERVLRSVPQKPYFSLKPDSRERSYFRKRSSLSPQQKGGSAESIGKLPLSSQLAEQWQAHPELSCMSNDFENLSDLLRGEVKEDTEISPLIYVMY